MELKASSPTRMAAHLGKRWRKGEPVYFIFRQTGITQEQEIYLNGACTLNRSRYSSDKKWLTNLSLRKNTEKTTKRKSKHGIKNTTKTTKRKSGVGAGSPSPPVAPTKSTPASPTGAA